MIRRITALTVALVLHCGTAAAQTEIPEFNKLRTPTSPAFVVLGTTPEDVQRPNTPSSFAFSLLQGIGSGAGAGAGGDFGVEVAPYWLVSHPNLTLDQYYQGGWAANLARTATVSFATLKADDEDAPSGASRDIGVGFRTRLLDGTVPSDACAKRMVVLRTQLGELATHVASGVARAIAAEPVIASNQDRLEALRASLTEEYMDKAEGMEGKVDECVDELSARRGFQMDAAAGAAWRLPNQEPDDAALRSGAVWLTPSWTGTNVSWAGVARYRWNEDDDAENLVDLGVRGIYAWSDYGLSLELVNRRPTGDGDDQYRVSLISDILLREDLWVTLSFGRDFTREDGDALFALANLQWNIGERSISVK